MEILISDKMQTVKTITPSKLKVLLAQAKNERPMFIYGRSGRGKSKIIKTYCKENNLMLVIYSLATEMAEAFGGIPHVTAVDYFTRLLDKRLQPMLEVEGKGYVLFLDEMNQASEEVMNACYSLCHPDPEERNWNGHSLRYLQVVAAGNLANGDDGTTYLTEVPTPLHNRFRVFELVSNKSDTKNHLKEQYKNIPQVVKYIDVLLEEDIPPRDIELILKDLQDGVDPDFMSSKLTDSLTIKLLNIQKKVKSVDPAKAFKACQETYNAFIENGKVLWAGDYIEEKEELLKEFRSILSEEEITAITKGGED